MKVKYLEEDFKVGEIVDFDFKKEGRYACFLMTKKGWGTPKIVAEVARRLRINSKIIGYAGNKDKRAVTEQHITFPMDAIGNFSNVENIRIKDASFKFLGMLDERINLGDLKGNSFEIIVRHLDNEVEFNFDKLKNYFGEQRFGKDKSNVAVGIALLKKDFQKACELIGLEVNDGNYVNALKTIDARTLRIYACAYQSWLWNKVAEKINNVEKLEIVGFLTEFQNETVKKLYESFMEKDGIKLSDFMIKPLKEISVEGTMRNLFMNMEKFNYSWDNDELFLGKKKCVFSFELGKGSYATVVVDLLFR